MTRADIIDSLEDEYGLKYENLTEREIAIIGHITKNIRTSEIKLLLANGTDTGQDKCHIQRVTASTLPRTEKIKEVISKWYYTRNREMLSDEFLNELASSIDIALT